MNYKNDYKNIVGQHCYGYTPKTLVNLLSNGPNGGSCYNCTHYMRGNGNCSKNLYEPMFNIFNKN